MAESYFKDPLLAKWEQTVCDETRSRLRVLKETTPATQVLIFFAEQGVDRAIHADLKALENLIRAELSGARRARERAVLMRDGNASTENDEKYTRRQRERANAAKDAAQYILEVLDGE